MSPEVGLLEADPPSPLVETAWPLARASPLVPDAAPTAIESVVLLPLVAEPDALPSVRAAPELPLVPVSPLTPAVAEPAAPLPPVVGPVPVPPVAPEAVWLVPDPAPVLPLLPVLPLPAAPLTEGLDVAAPVSPPVAVDEVCVSPVLPEVAVP